MRSLTSLSLFGPAFAFAFAFALAGVAGCASAPEKKPVDKPLVPTMQEEAPRAEVDSHLDDVKKAAAEQLECPLDQVNVVCMRRDTEGECIAVKADGCDRTYEYQFGDG